MKPEVGQVWTKRVEGAPQAMVVQVDVILGWSKPGEFKEDQGKTLADELITREAAVTAANARADMAVDEVRECLSWALQDPDQRPSVWDGSDPEGNVSRGAQLLGEANFDRIQELLAEDGPLPEVACPACSATIRARLADRPVTVQVLLSDASHQPMVTIRDTETGAQIFGHNGISSVDVKDIRSRRAPAGQRPAFLLTAQTDVSENGVYELDDAGHLVRVKTS